MPDSKVEVKACHCAYESDCHGIEMIKSPSGKEWAIGGTNTQDRWKFCPWCGGSLSRSPIANNGVSLEEFRMHVLNVLKKRFPHVGEKSYENIKDAQDEILVKLQPTAPRGGGEEICICSAVKTEDGDIIKGHRHHDCFRAIESRNKKILKEQGAQGFITSHGRYVDRKEGCSLMRLAGRKSRAGFEFKEDDILTSEDLY